MNGTHVPPGAWSGTECDPALLEIVSAYGALPGVVAVAIAGSLAAGTADTGSDLDLYVYAPQPLPIQLRAEVAARFAQVSEVGNVAWEPGDEWLDARTGRHVDVIYRTPAWIEDQLDRVLVRHEASTGYSTCFWHNVLHSAPLVDPSDWYGRLQERSRQPYPLPLRQAIIAKNHPILRRALSSYLHQIARAVARDDAVSAQHRLTALLASYFDILYAVNEIPHPGEKRQLRFALANSRRTWKRPSSPCSPSPPPRQHQRSSTGPTRWWTAWMRCWMLKGSSLRQLTLTMSGNNHAAGGLPLPPRPHGKPHDDVHRACVHATMARMHAVTTWKQGA